MTFPALVLAAQATAAAAVIPSDPTLFDLRLVVMTDLSEHEEPTFQQAGQLGLFYFLGATRRPSSESGGRAFARARIRSD